MSIKHPWRSLSTFSPLFPTILARQMAESAANWAGTSSAPLGAHQWGASQTNVPAITTRWDLSFSCIDSGHLGNVLWIVILLEDDVDLIQVIKMTWIYQFVAQIWQYRLVFMISSILVMFPIWFDCHAIPDHERADTTLDHNFVNSMRERFFAAFPAPRAAIEVK